MDYSSLRRQPAGILANVNRAVEALLSHENFLPVELRVKLDTFHADLVGILEDRDDESSTGGRGQQGT